MYKWKFWRCSNLPQTSQIYADIYDLFQIVVGCVFQSYLFELKNILSTRVDCKLHLKDLFDNISSSSQFPKYISNQALILVNS